MTRAPQRLLSVSDGTHGVDQQRASLPFPQCRDVWQLGGDGTSAEVSVIACTEAST